MTAIRLAGDTLLARSFSGSSKPCEYYKQGIASGKLHFSGHYIDLLDIFGEGRTLLGCCR